MDSQEKLQKYYNKFLEKNVNYIDGQKIDSTDKRVTAIHFKRGMSLGKAIQNLSINGPAVEIGILLRSLFNIRVNLHWMLADSTDERLKRYYDFRHIYRKKTMDYLVYGGTEVDQRQSEEVISEFKRIKEKYNLKTDYEFNVWANKSIWKISKDVGAKTEYQSLYAKTSDLEHTNSNVEKFYLKIGDNGKIEEYGNQHKELVISFILMAIHYLLVIKHLTAKTFHFDDKLVEKEISKFKIYQTENFKKHKNT